MGITRAHRLLDSGMTLDRTVMRQAVVAKLPTAVNSPTSSKKKPQKTLLTPKKNPALPLARSSHRTFSGICCCEPSQNSEQRRSASRNYDLVTLSKPTHSHFYTCTHTHPHTHAVTLCTHAHPCSCTLLGNMRVTHTVRTQQRGLIGVGGWTGGIPSCELPTNQCRQPDKHVCNRILTAHCVLSPPKRRRKKPN